MNLRTIFIKYQVLFVLLILLSLSIPPRLWQLTTKPPVIVDEPAYLRDIHKLLASSTFHGTEPQWDASQAELMYYPTIFFIKSGISNELLALRLVSVLWSILALIPFYFITRKYTNNLIAYCITLAFSYSYYFLQFSRVGWGVIYPVTAGLYLLWILDFAIETYNLFLIIVAGIIQGLMFYMYRSAEIYIGASFLFLSVRLLQVKKSAHKKIFVGSLFFFSSLIVAAPWFYQIATHWNEYMLRGNNVSILHAVKPYHGSSDQKTIIIYQLLTSIKSWLLLLPVQGGGFEDQRYLPLIYTPINIALILFFWIGFFIAIKKFSKTFVWFCIYFFGLIFGQIVTIDPPNGARALVFLPVIYLFSALAFYEIYKRFSTFAYISIIFVIVFSVIAYVDFLIYQYWMTWIKVWISY